jgi:hypothetical protein
MTKRRNIVKILGMATLAPHFHALSAAVTCHEHLVALAPLDSQPSKYQLQFFTPEEHELVDELTELIIPADGHSPGAQAANVSLFADLVLATGGQQAKQQWRNGLRAIKQQSEQSPLAEVLSKAAANEGNPNTELEHFFITLKEMTVAGYYTSSIGIHQDLGYRGNRYLTSFPGCTHPDHQN